MIPQAFTTRDTTEAYKWLMTLPPSVREEMKSMEQVVSLYLRTKRLGAGNPTSEELIKNPPANSRSSQDFQKNLKDLQTELEQFDFTPELYDAGPRASTEFRMPPGTGISNAGSPAPGSSPPITSPSPSPSSPQPQGIQTSGQSQPHSQGSFSDLQGNSLSQNIFSAMRLDPKSRQIVQEVREGLNLSSDMEVIRMSLVIAYKSFQELIK